MGYDVTRADLHTISDDLDYLYAQGEWSAWGVWVHSWTDVTLGDGNSKGRYCEINDLVLFMAELIFGTTTSVSGVVSLNYPATAANVYTAGFMLGKAALIDASTSFTYVGDLSFTNTTGAGLRYHAVGGTNIYTAPVDATVPFTWANADKMLVQGFYEKA